MGDRRTEHRHGRAGRPAVAGGGRPAPIEPLTRMRPDLTVERRVRDPGAQRPAPGGGGCGGPRPPASGRTSGAAPGLLGVTEPDFGVLLDDMFLDEGDEIPVETLRPATRRGRDGLRHGDRPRRSGRDRRGRADGRRRRDARDRGRRQPHRRLAGAGSPTPSPTTRPRGRSSWAAGSPRSTRSTCAWSGCCSTATGRRSRAGPVRPPSAILHAASSGWRTSSARPVAGCAAATSCSPGRCTAWCRSARATLPGRVRSPGTVTVRFAVGARRERRGRDRSAGTSGAAQWHEARKIADALIRARLDRTPVAPFTRNHLPRVDTAYKAQALVVEHRLQAGEHIIGAKLGLTSRVKRAGAGHPRAGLRPADIGHGGAPRRAGAARRAHPSARGARDRIPHREADRGRRPRLAGCWRPPTRCSRPSR